MKYILFLLMIGSCTEKKPKSDPKIAITQISKEDSIVILAKRKADSVFYYVNIAVNEMVATDNPKLKKAAGVKMDKACKPFQKTLDSLKLLVPARAKEIDEYRQSLLNKVKTGAY